MNGKVDIDTISDVCNSLTELRRIDQMDKTMTDKINVENCGYEPTTPIDLEVKLEQIDARITKLEQRANRVRLYLAQQIAEEHLSSPDISENSNDLPK